MIDTIVLIALGSSVGINIVLLGAVRTQTRFSSMYRKHADEWQTVARGRARSHLN